MGVDRTCMPPCMPLTFWGQPFWKDALRFYADIYYWPLFAFLVLTLLTFAIRPPNNKFKKQ